MTETISAADFTAGTIRVAKEIGWVGRYKVVVVRCADCGAHRWAMAVRPPERCRICSGLITIKSALAACPRVRPSQGERQRGAKNLMWKGGRVGAGKKGRYVYVLMEPGNPLAMMANRSGYAMEHRLVMARSLGRALHRWEQVHHINGNRQDNRVENLELWKHSQPSGVRHADYHCPGCQCTTMGV